MNSFLPFLIIGVATGAVYGLAATGLILTYKTSGIFNFAYGAVSALATFLYYYLRVTDGLAWPFAVGITLIVMTIVGGYGLELLARTVSPYGSTIRVVATVGLILLTEGVGLLWFPSNPPTIPDFLPQQTIKISTVNVTWAQIIVFAISVILTAILYWFFRTVRLGIAMRAVVDNPDLLAMSGEDPIRVRRSAWAIGTLFASIAGLLIGPGQLLDTRALTLLIFAAFGAAAIGQFSNLPVAFLGGIAVGVIGALSDKYAATVTWLVGIPPAVPFIILFIVLIVTPKRRLAERRLVSVATARSAYRAPMRIRLGAGSIAIAVAAVLPLMVGSKLSVWSGALVYLILFLSLGLLVKTSGQVSLCHLAFAAIGAAAFGHFATGMGIPWLPALLLAMLVAVPIGAVIAIPAIRLSGVFLALATLGFGIILEQLFYNQNYMFGITGLGVAAPRPAVNIGGWHMASDKGFYYVLLIIAVIVAVVIAVLERSRLGRLLRALSDSSLALETLGASSNVTRVLVFCISASFASLAGALLAMLYHVGVGSYFSSFTSLILVALVVIVTVGEPWYAIVAALGYAVVPSYITVSNVSTYLEMLFGFFAITAALTLRSGTMPAGLRRALDRLGGVRAPADNVDVPPDLVAQPSEPTAAVAKPAVTSDRPRRTTGGLEIEDISVRFGGVHAVDGLSLSAPVGQITGLVGPNGAGKTTSFNVCSGLIRPVSGQVTLHGTALGRTRAAGRAQLGLGRTFQRSELFDSLTVRENVALGYEAATAGANPITQLLSTGRSRRMTEEASAEAVELTGISRLLDIQAGLLPAGQRRLVELARVLAGPFDFLMLDEPSAGLDGSETEHFGEVLKTVVRERGLGILLVEHDMALVRQVCQRVYVLDFGRLIFQGTPDEMHANEQVQAAYLGSAAVVEESML